LEGQITIVRETTTQEKTGEAGVSCALIASVARLFSRPLAQATLPKLANPQQPSQKLRPTRKSVRKRAETAGVVSFERSLVSCAFILG
jgi:hypothetical protein